MSLAPLVFGTAGHVDHGKTSLVKALTGVDLDRLPEEKARGITIALGFTPLTLPSGRIAGIVDVPGHERLVRTMIAGASGLDAVVLCVSGVEGVMPQTREHLDILGLLGVSAGIVAVTMADLVDPELLSLCVEEIGEQVRGTFLEGAPILATSAVTRLGLDALVAALDAISPPPRHTDRPFRLPVDRAFARKGFGTVVTGTAWSGRLADGAEVEIQPGGRRARVRGVQVHGATVTEAYAGARTALNLAGVELDEVGRGSWITAPGTLPAPLVIDARYTHLPDAPLFADEARLTILLGTREVEARVVPLDAEGLVPGETCHVQLRLGEPLPCLAGDRFVARRASPANTVGGGVILDPFAAVARRKDAARTAAMLDRIEAGDAEAWLQRAGPAGLSEAEVVARLGAPCGTRIGERWYAADVAEAHRAAVREAVHRFHREHPLSTGANRKSLRNGVLLALGERDYLALVEDEVAAGRLAAEGGRVRAPTHAVALSPAQEAWRARVGAHLLAAGLEGSADLREVAPDPAYDALVHLLRERGEAEQIGDRAWSGAVLTDLVERVRTFFASHPTLDPAAFKELTGLSRRTAIPLLEWLDGRGITRRVGDARVPGRAFE
ncbi:MAG: selenocysteine-specific translation elongation factor [Pseudomonadota bacterium]|nr:selenocysteine-specific translation elongation factor [Pseudomonadota bacterium]